MRDGFGKLWRLYRLKGDGLHRDEIPPGTLHLLILKTLARSGEMHGWRKQLEVEMKQFERVIGAITRVIEAV